MKNWLMLRALITNATKNSSSTSSGDSTSANMRVKYLYSKTSKNRSINWTMRRKRWIPKFYWLLQLRPSIRRRRFLSGLKIKWRKSMLDLNFMRRLELLTISRHRNFCRSTKHLKQITSKNLKNSKMSLKSQKKVKRCKILTASQNLPDDLKCDNILISSKYFNFFHKIYC